ncbi:MAG: T9SS type A sorting domain-containing protein [Muribaculaceae bacterium]|nr:T9SS type A sorting domain-containing protein [Muribaculaceae bacterium]
MFKKVVILIMLLVLTGAPCVQAQRQWEELENELITTDRQDDGDVLEVSVRDGYVYVTTSKPVTVKIFSILGQLIAQKNLQPGTSRTRITARGIYILKVGALTRRITI